MTPPALVDPNPLLVFGQHPVAGADLEVRSRRESPTMVADQEGFPVETQESGRPEAEKEDPVGPQDVGAPLQTWPRAPRDQLA